MQLRLLLSLCLTVVFAGACDSPVEVGGDDDLSAGVGVGDERLLSDAEMRVLPDAAAPDENPAWAEWVRANHEPVRSLTSGNFADLEFLKPLLQHARIVQLGESTHGAAEYSLAKTRLIRFLHQEMGFEVLAFESSLLECYMAGLRVGTATPPDLLRDCLFGVWHVAEALPLFEYIASTRGSDRPLIMAGFDVQVSGNAFRSRPQWVREVVAAADPAMADSAARVEARLVELATLAPTERLPLIAAEGAAMSRFYLDLAALLTERAAAVRAAFADRPGMAAIAVQHARMAPVYIEVLGAPNASAAHPIRDRGMADNLEFLLSEMYPGKKVVVWAHNGHIRHRGEDAAGRPDMGTWVAERHRHELYTIALYAYRGRMRSNAGMVYDVYPFPGGSLESILYRPLVRHHFVDLSRAGRSPATEWMFAPILTHSSGANPEPMVVGDQYDGILFIDRVREPGRLQ